jgi:two-component system, cell cycle response regulator
MADAPRGVAVAVAAEPTDRILVVEDDDDAREALAELLVEQGYDVATARDGIEAIEMAERAPPTLVISDVCMPRRDGFALIGELRRHTASADTPIILMSGITERERRVRGLDLGADDYLGKPVDADELLARVRVHLRNARRRQELERRSLLDPLTGVLNRRGLMAALRREYERVHRGGAPLSVLVFDVDRFKELNDNHGHQVGDLVLRHIAREISDAVRAVDHVGRVGGDEFLVVIPDADEAAVDALAARLAELRLPPLMFDGTALDVGVSIGVATLRAGETVDQLLARGDAAMYQRKRQRKSM